MNKIVHGPWGGPPVKQTTEPDFAGQLRPGGNPPGDWWRRDSDGTLWVWCAPPRRQPCWCPAPVPPARLTAPIPDRAPDPARITFALDVAGMDGPEVDEALGVHNALDTVVDAWETGDVVPSQDEIRRLATLTNYGPGWFYLGPMPQFDGPVFFCERGRN